MPATAPRGDGDPLARIPSPALVLTGIGSVQIGSALAATLFHRAGPDGVVLLRLISASVVLLVIWRPRPSRLSVSQLRLAAGFGLVLALMNLSFYEAISRIPLGIAVAVEFLGPLGVALAGSRARRDLAWVALAALGVLALTEGPVRGLDGVGLGFALVAAAAWAGYIVLNSRMGQSFRDGSGTALAMCTAAIVAVPFGALQGGSRLVEPHVLAVGLAVGILSSAIPYSLELEALRRIAPGVFGVLMSLEPAVAALAGFVILGQGLSLREWGGIALVMAASAGASIGARARPLPVVD